MTGLSENRRSPAFFGLKPAMERDNGKREKGGSHHSGSLQIPEDFSSHLSQNDLYPSDQGKKGWKRVEDPEVRAPGIYESRRVLMGR
jgi:hypothetical protein